MATQSAERNLRGLKRQLTHVKRLVLEERDKDARSQLTETYRLYDELERLQWAYIDSIVETDAGGAEKLKAATDWIEQVELYYNPIIADIISKLNKSQSDVTSSQVKNVPSTSNVTPVDLGKEIATVLSLPRLECPVFSGNPRDWSLFKNMFDSSIGNKISDESQKLSHLMNCVTGEAKDAIKHTLLLNSSTAYTEAVKILSDRYGNEQIITKTTMSDLRSGKSVRTQKEIRFFVDDLEAADKILSKMKTYGEVNTTDFIKDMLIRCSHSVILKWKKRATRYLAEHDTYPNFKEFITFMKEVALQESDPAYGLEGTKDVLERSKKKESESKQRVVVQQTHVSGGTQGGAAKVSSGAGGTSKRFQNKASPRCYVCNGEHWTNKCQVLRNKSVEDRISYVKSNKLCMRCLGKHDITVCKHAWVCGIDGCSASHNRILHRISQAKPQVRFDISDKSDVGSGFVNVDHPEILLPVLPVLVNGVRVHAVLDSGSTHSFVTERLVRKLELPVTHFKRKVKTVLGREDKNLKHVKITVSDQDNVNHFVLNSCMVLNCIPAQAHGIGSDWKKFDHLADLPLDTCNSENVDILIGQDNGHLLAAREVRVPDGDGRGKPYATKSVLGWTVQGVMQGQCDSEFVPAKEVSCGNIVIDDLKEDISKLWDLEKDDEVVSAWSVEDTRVHDLWTREVRIENDHYVLPIPFKDPDADFPNNRLYAIGRLESVEKKLHRSGMMEAYQKQLQSLLDDGYAERVPLEELSRDDGKVFYLPHFPVTRDDKPGKVRIVHDCAATFKGVSLNNMCHQGPDLINKLQNILVRFREHTYAFTSDVSAMYLQVKIPEEQRDVLRFLWRDADGELIELRMTSHLFGGVWCASSSTFALRRAVEDAQASAEVMKAVVHNTYVDDLLQSVTTLSLAIMLARDVQEALAWANFIMAKYVSNHPDILKHIPQKDRVFDIKELPGDVTCKALGLRWDVNGDGFFYERVGSWNWATVTKRKILSLVSSLYDPLGLIAPIIVVGRMIFQQVTKLKIGWDDSVPLTVIHDWEKWWDDLEHLNGLRFSRCMVGEKYLGATCSLHHFADASEKAYGMCSYLRVQRGDEVKITLLQAKARVAPVKPVTIPRLELCAAMLAVKMDVVLRNEMSIELGESTFWSDSTVVLHYIKGEDLRLKTFVANRVSYIREHSKPSSWRHVRTADNPADVVSRGCIVEELPVSWRSGPEFLYGEPCDWPEEDVGALPSNLEVKVGSTMVDAQPENDNEESRVEREHPIDALLRYHGNMSRMLVSVAWLVRWCRFARRENVFGNIKAKELKDAEELVVKHVQANEFVSELEDLWREGQVSKSSTLRSLYPVLLDGILVVGGRLHHASDLTYAARSPAILPRKHAFSELVMRAQHDRAHLGVEWTLARLREKYWIVGARTSLRMIRRRCMICQKYFGKPENQLMANLPEERCVGGLMAFRHAGLDLFGNFYVTVGRATVKRYGVIFTCFATRAIHLEVVHQMDAESFTMALSRFCARRGYPESIKSDQGKNIVGAVGEIRKAWQEMDLDQVQKALRKQGVEWSFNPPKASQMGGVWERMIRTIRKTLLGVLNPRTSLSDEILQTVFCEVENLINSRPITRVSDDADDGTLSPNHLLILQSNSPEDEALMCSGALLRGKMKRIRSFVDQFWNKWRNEYLLEQQMRKKWDRVTEDIKVGELVVIHDKQVARGRWPLGRITEVMRGRDNRVRSAKVLTAGNSEYHRPVCKLVKLELD